ncbi:MAG TPA: hypothetical protein VII56_10570 [Rhizomicrobium sp.]
MARKTKDMQKLIELRDRQAGDVADLEKRLAEARVRLHAYDTAIATMGGHALPVGGRKRQPNVKKTVLNIVNEAAAHGVTANEVVDKGAAQGRTLERNSVSSLLSRLKREGVLTFDGARYRPADVKPTNTVPLFKTVS